MLILESEYWLSSLKVLTIIVFVIVGVVVNVGVNDAQTAIGLDNWRIPGSSFVGELGGIARAFVAASLAMSWSTSGRYPYHAGKLICASLAHSHVFRWRHLVLSS
jgi:hypothetical protein